jgi:DNA polymerase III delta subunit
VGDRTRITVDDVKEIASSSKAFNVFELARFLGLRDLRNALLSLDKLMLNGEETPMMLGLFPGISGSCGGSGKC